MLFSIFFTSNQCWTVVPFYLLCSSVVLATRIIFVVVFIHIMIIIITIIISILRERCVFNRAACVFSSLFFLPPSMRNIVVFERAAVTSHILTQQHHHSIITDHHHETKAKIAKTSQYSIYLLPTVWNFKIDSHWCHILKPLFPFLHCATLVTWPAKWDTTVEMRCKLQTAILEYRGGRTVGRSKKALSL